MKTYLLFISFLFTIHLTAQDRIDYKEPLGYKNSGAVEMTKVLEFSGKTKAELYELAEVWFVKKFVGDPVPLNSGIDSKDKLMGRGIIITANYRSEILYVLTINVKEEKIKIVMDEIVFFYPNQEIIVGVETAQTTKQAFKVIGDQALYKRNGKARINNRKAKLRVLKTWHSIVDGLENIIIEKDGEATW